MSLNHIALNGRVDVDLNVRSLKIQGQTVNPGQGSFDGVYHAPVLFENTENPTEPTLTLSNPAESSALIIRARDFGVDNTAIIKLGVDSGNADSAGWQIGQSIDSDSKSSFYIKTNDENQPFFGSTSLFVKDSGQISLGLVDPISTNPNDLAVFIDGGLGVSEGTDNGLQFAGSKFVSNGGALQITSSTSQILQIYTPVQKMQLTVTDSMVSDENQSLIFNLSNGVEVKTALSDNDFLPCFLKVNNVSGTNLGGIACSATLSTDSNTAIAELKCIDDSSNPIPLNLACSQLRVNGSPLSSGGGANSAGYFYLTSADGGLISDSSYNPVGFDTEVSLGSEWTHPNSSNTVYTGSGGYYYLIAGGQFTSIDELGANDIVMRIHLFRAGGAEEIISCAFRVGSFWQVSALFSGLGNGDIVRVEAQNFYGLTTIGTVNNFFKATKL